MGSTAQNWLLRLSNNCTESNTISKLLWKAKVVAILRRRISGPYPCSITRTNCFNGWYWIDWQHTLMRNPSQNKQDSAQGNHVRASYPSRIPPREIMYEPATQAGFRPGKSCTSQLHVQDSSQGNHVRASYASRIPPREIMYEPATEPDGTHRGRLRESLYHRCCLCILVSCTWYSILTTDASYARCWRWPVISTWRNCLAPCYSAAEFAGPVWARTTHANKFNHALRTRLPPNHHRLSQTSIRGQHTRLAGRNCSSSHYENCCKPCGAPTTDHAHTHTHARAHERTRAHTHTPVNSCTTMYHLFIHQTAHVEYADNRSISCYQIGIRCSCSSTSRVWPTMALLAFAEPPWHWYWPCKDKRCGCGAILTTRSQSILMVRLLDEPWSSKDITSATERAK